MDFVEILSDAPKRRRLLGGFAALLVLAVACAGVGVAIDFAPLWVFAIVLLAGLVGVTGKLLSAIAVYLNGTTRRLKVLNDRYDDTEVWLEQFDKGTRATFTNLSNSLRDAAAHRASLEASLAANIEAGREELRARSSKIEESLGKYATRESLDASVKAAEAASAKLSGLLASSKAELEKAATELGKKADESKAAASKHAEQIAKLAEADKKLETAIAAAKTEIEAAKAALTQRIDAIGKQQDTAAKAATEHTRKDLIDSASRLEAISSGLSVAASQASRLRNEGYAQFTRQIGDEFVGLVQGEMGTKLGLKIAPRELRYLERKVQQIEAVCEGRLATTAEDAITRVLAARSLKADELRVLEIGVLFGVGAAFMHTALAPFYKRVHLVLLDPFDGYYGSDHLDPLTGQKVTRAAVERNLRRASIRPEDTTVLEGFSTDDAVLAAAKGEGPYDVIVIDGDHSYKGVEADFKRYADLVRPGGILIVDDYGSKDWPDVTKFVDAVVKPDMRFEGLGIYSRTALFKRQTADVGKTAPAEKSVAPKSEEKSVESSPKPQKPARAASNAAKKAAPKQSSKKEASAEPVVVRSEAAKSATSAKSRSKSGSVPSASPGAKE